MIDVKRLRHNLPLLHQWQQWKADRKDVEHLEKFINGSNSVCQRRLLQVVGATLFEDEHVAIFVTISQKARCKNGDDDVTVGETAGHGDQVRWRRC